MEKKQEQDLQSASSSYSSKEERKIGSFNKQVILPKSGLNFDKNGNSNNDDDWGTTTPEVHTMLNRKFSDFEVAKNHAHSKRKESNITEEVIEDDEEEW
jgi:hypothetical protein